MRGPVPGWPRCSRWLLGAVGIIGAAPGEPIPPDALSFGASAATTVAAVLLALALAWLVWPMLMRRVGVSARPLSDGAGVGMLLVLLPLAVVVWVANPMAALLLLPAVHLWLLIVSPELRPRPLAALALVAAGFLPLALLVAFYADQLGLGPGRVAWMAVLLVAGGHVGFPAVLLWIALARLRRRCRHAFSDSRLAGAWRRPTRMTMRSRFAGRCPTPGRARSAVRSRLCDDRLSINHARR